MIGGSIGSIGMHNVLTAPELSSPGSARYLIISGSPLQCDNGPAWFMTAIFSNKSIDHQAQTRFNPGLSISWHKLHQRSHNLSGTACRPVINIVELPNSVDDWMGTEQSDQDELIQIKRHLHQNTCKRFSGHRGPCTEIETNARNQSCCFAAGIPNVVVNRVA